MITQRHWLAILLRFLGKRDVIHYKVTGGFITIEQPMSEADMARFRAELELRHRFGVPR